MKMNFKEHNYIQIVMLILMILSTIILAFSLYNLDQELQLHKIKINSLIHDIGKSEQFIIMLQEKIDLQLKNVPTSIPASSVEWSRSTITKLICFSCVLTTLISTKLFFAYTPYLLSYSAQSWSFKLISYFYPVICTLDNKPKVFRDTFKNLFELTLDTNLDTFSIRVLLDGAQIPITITQFINWALGGS